MSETNDLTVVYYTANKIPQGFANITREHLLLAMGRIPLVIVYQGYGTWENSLDVPELTLKHVDFIPSHLNIYRQALIGAKEAKTKYIALAEDDVLYPAEHFKHRPSPGVFAYNKSVWSIYTWVKPPIFSYKDRRNMYSLICERELFIEAMEERFAKYPTEDNLFLGNWAEPGKYEKNLGVTERKTEVFYTNIPLVAFSHETALSYQNLGKRKKLGDLRVTALPHWGSAEKVIKLYGE